MTHEENDLLIADERFCEFVGAISEGLLACSYNDTEIRDYWRRGVLDQYIAERVAEEREVTKHGSNYSRCVTQLGSFYREDGKYSETMAAFARKLNGWPWNWGDDDLDPLTDEERQLAFGGT